MQLLLFLSALLAGLSGAFSGDRAVPLGGQHREAAISRAADAVAEVSESITDVRADAPPRILPALANAFAIASAPLALPVYLMMGRWLE